MMLHYLSKISALLKSRVFPVLKDPLFLARWEEGSYLAASAKKRITAHLSGLALKDENSEMTGDAFMFIEDMYSSVMPFAAGRRSVGTIDIMLAPADSGLEGILAKALSQEPFAVGFADAVCRFVRDTAHSLFWYGRAAYEIIVDRDSAGKVTNLELIPIHPLSIRKAHNSYYQVIPWWVAKKARTRVKVVKLPEENVFVLEFPRALGGRRALRKTLRRLKHLSRTIIPEFSLAALKKQEDIGFNFLQFVQSKDLETAMLSKRFGWSQRGTVDKYFVEFYSIKRYLRYRKAQALVREEIINCLQKRLISSTLNLGCKIEMQGIPTVEEIIKLQEELERGDIAFEDVFNALQY